MNRKKKIISLLFLLSLVSIAKEGNAQVDLEKVHSDSTSNSIMTCCQTEDIILKNIDKQNNISSLDILRGREAGLSTSRRSEDPNESIVSLIRGITSFEGVQPLIVVNGYPVKFLDVINPLKNHIQQLHPLIVLNLNLQFHLYLILYVYSIQ